MYEFFLEFCRVLRKKKSRVDKLRFHDRVDAGNILADRLRKSPLLDPQNRGNAIVLGIPRGGAVIAEVLARKLSIELDIVIGRKLGAPGNPELAIGAVMEDGTSYLNDYLINALSISEDYIGHEKEVQIAEVERRSSLYRGNRDYQLMNRVVILTDDGIATGATVIAAARWIRKHTPDFLMIAVPIAAPRTLEILRQEADSVEAIQSPEDLNTVGQFYENFQPVSDEEVREILKRRHH
jgi:predicted phosphoribosyltransferase